MWHKKFKYTVLILVTLMSVLAVDGYTQDADERKQLLERRDGLQAGIAALREEQDFLLFRKEMYAADSKYLLLDLRKRIGTLKYRDRTIKAFSFTYNSADGRPALRGAQVLTARVERSGKKRALVFGSALVLRTKQPAGVAAGAEARHFILSSRDMVSLFSALDTGSRAYVLAR